MLNSYRVPVDPKVQQLDQLSAAQPPGPESPAYLQSHSLGACAGAEPWWQQRLGLGLLSRSGSLHPHPGEEGSGGYLLASSRGCCANAGHVGRKGGHPAAHAEGILTAIQATRSKPNMSLGIP